MATVAQVQRVAVIGCGGSGKTTLANELAARLGVPVIHIDSHYWQFRDGQRVESTPEEWATCHRELIARPAWVMDGMKLGLLRERLVRADTVVYLDPPTRSCLLGIFRRRVRYRGQLRPDLGVYDRINREFLSWVWSFRRRQRPGLLEVLTGFDGRAVVIRRRGDVRRFLDSVGIEPRVVGSTTEPYSDEADAGRPPGGNELVDRRGSWMALSRRIGRRQPPPCVSAARLKA